MGHSHSHEHDPRLHMGEVPAEVLTRIRQRSSLLKNGFSRRDAVRLMGLAGIAGIAGCGAGGTASFGSSSNSSSGTSGSSSSSSGSPTTTGSGTTTCVKGLSKTEGPYWVDGDTNTPQRSDIRSDTKGTIVQTGYQGVTLALSFAVYTYSANGCTPLQNARVDIWHASAQGKYSDISGEGTSDDNYLRGYQLSDTTGLVSFTTIYPGGTADAPRTSTCASASTTQAAISRSTAPRRSSSTTHSATAFTPPPVTTNAAAHATPTTPATTSTATHHNCCSR
ncbi:MAG: hypothetical protein JSS87_04365 [Acidobacteria bacterium]|nr:hypothetical protein [Acidobacteriota bacterium]